MSMIDALPNAPDTLTEEVASNIQNRLCEDGFSSYSRAYFIFTDLVLYFCANREASMDDALLYAFTHQKYCSTLTFKSMKSLVYDEMKLLNEKKIQEGKEPVKLKYYLNRVAYDEFFSKTT